MNRAEELMNRIAAQLEAALTEADNLIDICLKTNDCKEEKKRYADVRRRAQSLLNGYARASRIAGIDRMDERFVNFYMEFDNLDYIYNLYFIFV